jgi:hypothetical protein
MMGLLLLGGAALLGAGLLWWLMQPDGPPSLPPPREDPPRKPPHREEIVEVRLEYELDTGSLQLDPLRGPQGSLPDLARLNSGVRAALHELRALQVRVVLQEGQLVLRWMGSKERRPRVEEQGASLRRALSRNRHEPWRRIELLLRSSDLADRRWLLEASVRTRDPLREKVLHELMSDPHPPLAYQVLRDHGSPQQWLQAALQSHRPAEQRRDIVHCLRDEPPADRCKAVLALAAHPELHEVLPALIGWAEGEDAERAWIALMQHSHDPEILRLATERLGVLGTRRALPVLHEVKERLGPLQLQLRAQITHSLAAIGERCGAVAGALSIAVEGEPGALSVAEVGGLSPATRSTPTE